MKIKYAEAYTNTYNINLDIEIDGNDYQYNSTWSGVEEVEYEVTDAEFADVEGEENDAIHAAVTDYLLTVHRDENGNVLNGGRTKMDELVENIITD